MKNRILPLITIGIFILPSIGFSSVNLPGWYVSAKGGIFQGSFDQKYLDQTDIIKQNIETNTQQNGYTGGIAVGYQKSYCQTYLLGGELSANLDTHHSTFQSGASTAAFSDLIDIKSHVDLTFVPGILLTESISAYLKLGVSYASLTDNLSSPVGSTATMTGFSANKNILGAAAGIGIAKMMTPHISIFAEGNYHDYGMVDLPAFQNFTANYTHSTHVISSSIEVGAAYHF